MADFGIGWQGRAGHCPALTTFVSSFSNAVFWSLNGARALWTLPLLYWLSPYFTGSMKSSPLLPEPAPESEVRSPQADGLPPVLLTFDQELTAVESALQDLKLRHEQVQQDQQTQAQLQTQLAQVQVAMQQAPTPELQAELKHIQEKLDELSYSLESQLLSWINFQRPFWQILRFGGLGLVLGWGLAFWVSRSPQPNSPQGPPTEYRGTP
jgi:hypothetical protein